MRRELEEETGLSAGRIEPITWTSDVMGGPMGDLHFVTLHHLVRTHSGDPQLREPDKTEGWQWHALAELPQPVFAPAASLLATGWALDQADPRGRP